MTAPQSGFDVRAATPADVAIIAEYNLAMAFETEHKRLDPEVLHAGVAAVFADASRGRYHVVAHHGVVIACALITFEWSDWRNGLWWWLQSVYVHPDHRGRGVFAQLYRTLRARAAATEGVCGLRLYVEHDNVHAQRVYAALGMRPEPYRILQERLD